ncbi:hypothetical protein M388_10220 [Mesotoga sp. Brook.08.YT.4.2.5.4.]|nr:hypothetical protein M388_10220 [Mesotoga sp. Brook.08.YT.4.2.5.4.]
MENRGWGFERARETGSPLSGSQFTRRICYSFQSEDLFFVLG